MAKISLIVNGNPVTGKVDSRTLLVQFLREHLHLTGTYLGCDTSQCGACVVHLDLIDGFSAKEIAVDAVHAFTGAEGIISTRGTQIKRAKQLGMTAIQRGFMLDSRSLSSFEAQIQTSKPDFVEILPGLLPKVIAELKARLDVPIIAGGFIHEKEDVIAAIQAGALAVSASRPEIWSM